MAQPKRSSNAPAVAKVDMARKATAGLKNRHRALHKHAIGLSRTIAGLRGVTGIVFMGGLARGLVDEYSDLDIVVLLARRDPRLKAKIEAIGRADSERLSLDIDLEVHTLADFERMRREDNRRWECAHAEVVYDPDRRIRGMLVRIAKVPARFWTDRIVGDWTFFRWCVSNPDAPKSIAEICAERGDILGAHYTINYSIDLLLELLYALNKEFLPPPKWRMSYLKGLGWTPHGLDAVLREAISVQDVGPEDMRRRLRAIRKLHAPVDRKVREVTGLTDEEFWRHFLKVFVFEQ
jgi:predicted nucleotidyltransferase